jgi:hypothetical protein
MVGHSEAFHLDVLSATYTKLEWCMAALYRWRVTCSLRLAPALGLPGARQVPIPCRSSARRRKAVASVHAKRMTTKARFAMP